MTTSNSTAIYTNLTDVTIHKAYVARLAVVIGRAKSDGVVPLPCLQKTRRQPFSAFYKD
jgi:hypothetical protein